MGIIGSVFKELHDHLNIAPPIIAIIDMMNIANKVFFKLSFKFEKGDASKGIENRIIKKRKEYNAVNIVANMNPSIKNILKF